MTAYPVSTNCALPSRLSFRACALIAKTIAAVFLIGCGAFVGPAGGSEPQREHPVRSVPAITLETTDRPHAGVEVSIEAQALAGGVDFSVTWTNTTTASKPLPSIQLHGFSLGGEAWWSDFQHDGARVPVRGGVHHFGYPHGPSGHYAPLAVFGDSTRSMSVMYLYNALEDHHDLRGALERHEDGWDFVLRFANEGSKAHKRVRYPARLSAGESRTRTVAVRFGDQTTELRQLVSPYLSYYTETHGRVTYERDPRPVRGLAVARGGLTSDSNPFGFEMPYRPDLNGFAAWNRRLIGVSSSWRRVMLWAPTGLYRENKELNYPFQFTSFWLEGEKWGHHLGDAPDQLSSAVERTGLELGLWWGRSAQVMKTWDSPRFEGLNPTNDEHRELAFREMDLAVQAGATMVGLDAFPGGGGLAMWDGYAWLLELQSRYPTVTFITEKQKPDFMHRIAPTYFFTYDFTAKEARTVREASHLTQRHALADLLNPGHETWAGTDFTLLRTLLGRKIEPHLRQVEMQRLMEQGYVPVVFGSDFTPGSMADGLTPSVR